MQVAPRASLQLNTSYAKSELAKNTQRDVNHWKKVALDVSEVCVSKTAEGNWTVKLIDGKGNQKQTIRNGWHCSNQDRTG